MTASRSRGDERSFRCVLVGITASDHDKISPALDYGVRLALAHGALLTIHVMAPEVSIPLVSRRTTASEWLAAAQVRYERLGASAATEATRHAASFGLSPIVEHCRDLLEARGTRLTRLARVNDLTVLDADAGAASAGRPIIEDALFDTGSPVLVVPPGPASPTPARILIAWDGSAKAGRAVRDALPMLMKAECVEIVTVIAEKDLSSMAPGADLATYLDAHGVASCELDTLAAVDGQAGRRLAERIEESKPDLAVMGAFVHSRFREAVLGGVTRAFLDQPVVPLLMSH